MGEVTSTPKDFLNRRMELSNKVWEIPQEITDDFNEAVKKGKETYQSRSRRDKENSQYVRVP